MTSVTVSSPLLSDPPPAPPAQVRPVDPDFAITERDGFIESLAEFGARIDLRHAAGLAIAGIALLTAGYYIQTWETR
ncbi:hypothetical protein [Streptomyces sp. H27-H5]|uniref:hypothetical protein n=1 Tax=Streptomyces sp. H27-H5 TaxID=2996460 RepID=UPI0022706420|nr:hypothetical protein [Streptomyces sp. H27-H5]MCY0962451.1 hypothetical protein [Streptomyces sp. H27-H5]